MSMFDEDGVVKWWFDHEPRETEFPYSFVDPTHKRINAAAEWCAQTFGDGNWERSKRGGTLYFRYHKDAMLFRMYLGDKVHFFE